MSCGPCAIAGDGITKLIQIAAELSMPSRSMVPGVLEAHGESS